MSDVKGKRVVVFGGGDTAVDCLRCAIREGAASATAVARKPREALRAMVGELQQAQEEGAEILCGLQVERLVSAGGIVSAVLCRDGDGKELEVPADVVLLPTDLGRNRFPGWPAAALHLITRAAFAWMTTTRRTWPEFTPGVMLCAERLLCRRRWPTEDAQRGRFFGIAQLPDCRRARSNATVAAMCASLLKFRI